MRYNELKIKVDKDHLELLEITLVDAGFFSMLINDPEDEQDILAHPDTYKYDYIDDEIGSDPDRLPEITLYFTDDEKGEDEIRRAAKIVEGFKTRVAAEEYDANAAAKETDTAKKESDPAKKDIGLTVDMKIKPAGDDSEWLYKWQEFFKPTRVGDRIVVKPSWEAYDASPDELVIEMDPGMAFGSGLHETTSMCIKALEKYIPEVREDKQRAIKMGFRSEQSPRSRLKVLDVGCGTGILSIAAVMLGADECLAIDIDPDAVRVAQENVEKNGLADKITVQCGDLTKGVEYKPDIIVANLMADLVMKLTPAASRYLVPGGLFISSGILDSKEGTVTEVIWPKAFEIVEILHDGEWCAIIACKE